MEVTAKTKAPVGRVDRLFIGGQWVEPSSSDTIAVIDSATEELFFSVAEAKAADVSRAVAAAREAFDEGPWPRLTHAERARYMRAIGAELKLRGDRIGQIWPRESGVLHAIASHSGAGAQATFTRVAALAQTFPFVEPTKLSAGGQFGMIVREPVGVVAAIIPWNGPMTTISTKVAPALDAP
jgi:aldehyde dehydrogenase (NAD+)